MKIWVLVTSKKVDRWQHQSLSQNTGEHSLGRWRRNGQFHSDMLSCETSCWVYQQEVGCSSVKFRKEVWVGTMNVRSFGMLVVQTMERMISPWEKWSAYLMLDKHLLEEWMAWPGLGIYSCFRWQSNSLRPCAVEKHNGEWKERGLWRQHEVSWQIETY